MILNDNLEAFLNLIKQLRLENGISTEQLENELSIGEGWIKSIEDSELLPSVDVILSIIHKSDIVFQT